MPSWIDESLELAKQRQLRYFEFRATGMTRREAAKAAQYRPSAIQNPRKYIEPAEMRQRFQREMMRAGGGPEKIAETVLGAMDATLTEKDKDGGLHPTDHADHRVRVQAARLAKDLLMPEDRSQVAVAQTVVINLPSGLAASYAQTINGETK